MNGGILRSIFVLIGVGVGIIVGCANFGVKEGINGSCDSASTL